MKRIIVYLLALLPLQVLADYVDDINSATVKNESGHQVIYQMNVGSFSAEGTFAAAQQRLSELKTLGVDIVWLMPIYPRGGGINSPYAATNFQQTNPSYGTIADLKSFVNRAHELNMEVWLDWVPNHTATDADWVITHPEYYAKSGEQMIHPNGYGDVWQLDYSNTNLVNAMNDCLKFWIDQADIDGYRCDYISSPYIPTSYWQSTIPMIKSYKTGKKITFLGEADIAQHNDAARLKTAGFDYDYAWAYQTSLLNFGPNGVYAAPLRTNATTMLNASNTVSFKRMLYLTNHDQNWNEDKKTLTEKYGNNRYPLTVLAYTLYGMPLIYNGQEVGGNQPLNYFQDTKIDWTVKDDKMLNTIRTLTALKHTVPALSDDAIVNLITVSGNTSAMAFTRKSGDSEILVVMNMANSAGNATITGLTAGAWSLWLTSETIAQGTSRKQETFGTSKTINLEAKGYRVYVKGSYSNEDIPQKELDVYTPTLDDANEISIFFETATETTYNVWVWNDGGKGEDYAISDAWPGDAMKLMGQTDTGNYIYKYTITKKNALPDYLIISKNGGNNKIYNDINYVNHGYFVEGQTAPTQIISATTGINDITVVPAADNKCYDLTGRLLSQAPKSGLYIRGGKKFISR